MKRSINRLNIATTRASICLPGPIRSAETNPLATAASRQAAHSNAEPRASSKNLARWRPCRLPFPSAVLRSMERLARSSCSINSRRCRPADFEASSRKAAIQATKPSSTVRRNKHRVFRGQKGDPLNIQKRFIIMYVNRVFRLFFFRCQLS